MFDLSTLDHADAQILALHKAFTTFLREEKPYAAINEYKNGVLRAKMQIRKQIPSAAWAQLIGQCVSNLRDALDHMVFALSEKHLGRALTEAEATSVEFPIFLSDKDYAKRGRKGVAKTADAVQLAIASYQPYHRGHVPEKHPLWLLHKLANIKKHRSPLAAGVRTNGGEINVVQLDGFEITYYMLGFGAFKDGSPIAEIGLRQTRTDPEPEAEFDIVIPFDVAFGHVGPASGTIVLETLQEIRDYIRKTVIPELERFLS